MVDDEEKASSTKLHKTEKVFLNYHLDRFQDLLARFQLLMMLLILLSSLQLIYFDSKGSEYDPKGNY
jgi:hypothetical protein